MNLIFCTGSKSLKFEKKVRKKSFLSAVLVLCYLYLIIFIFNYFNYQDKIIVIGIRKEIEKILKTENYIQFLAGLPKSESLIWCSLALYISLNFRSNA